MTENERLKEAMMKALEELDNTTDENKKRDIMDRIIDFNHMINENDRIDIEKLKLMYENDKTNKDRDAKAKELASQEKREKFKTCAEIGTAGAFILGGVKVFTRGFRLEETGSSTSKFLQEFIRGFPALARLTKVIR